MPAFLLPLHTDGRNDVISIACFVALFNSGCDCTACVSMTALAQQHAETSRGFTCGSCHESCTSNDSRKCPCWAHTVSSCLRHGFVGCLSSLSNEATSMLPLTDSLHRQRLQHTCTLFWWELSDELMLRHCYEADAMYCKRLQRANGADSSLLKSNSDAQFAARYIQGCEWSASQY